MTGTRSLEGCPLENSDAFQGRHDALKKQPIAAPKIAMSTWEELGLGEGTR